MFTFLRSELSLRSLCVKNQSRELSLCNINLAYCLFWKNSILRCNCKLYFSWIFCLISCLIFSNSCSVSYHTEQDLWEIINKNGKQCTSFIYSKFYFKLCACACQYSNKGKKYMNFHHIRLQDNRSWTTIDYYKNMQARNREMHKCHYKLHNHVPV